MVSSVKVVRFAPVSITVVTVYRDLRCGMTRVTLAWDCDRHSDVLNAGGSASTSSSSSTAKGEYRLLLILECTDGDRGGIIVSDVVAQGAMADYLNRTIDLRLMTFALCRSYWAVNGISATYRLIRRDRNPR